MILALVMHVQFKNGRPVGWGVFTWTNGQRYEGEWKDGQPHGPGVFTWRDGKRYEGSTYNGKHEGKGKLIWPEGEVYIGDFHNGHEHGKGLFTSADGSRYCGEYVQGQGQGHVVVRFRDGSAYEGRWNSSSIDGHGVSYSNSSFYQGEFKGSLPWGYGVLAKDTGAQYSGSFAEALRNGSGVYSWPDGSRYHGEFFEGMQHGCGVQVNPGILFDYYRTYGHWEHGVFNDKSHPQDAARANCLVNVTGLQVLSCLSQHGSARRACLDEHMVTREEPDAGSVRSVAGEEQGAERDAAVSASRGHDAGVAGQLAASDAAFAAEAALQTALVARKAALAMAEGVPECADIDLALGDAVMGAVEARARSAVDNVDKPQVWVACLLGTLSALTLWVVFLLLAPASETLERPPQSLERGPGKGVVRGDVKTMPGGGAKRGGGGGGDDSGGGRRRSEAKKDK